MTDPKRCPDWCAFADPRHLGPCALRRKWAEYRQQHLVDPDEYTEDQRDRDEDADARNR
jgi:hypothetical protein